MEVNNISHNYQNIYPLEPSFTFQSMAPQAFLNSMNEVNTPQPSRSGVITKHEVWASPGQKLIPSKIIRKRRRDMTRRSRKSWGSRQQIFSKFNRGIEMDEEAWCNAPFEKTSKYIARRMHNTGITKVIDLHAGVGGSSIQLARKNIHVTAVEIDCNRIEMIKNNAKIYNVQNMIDTICADPHTVLQNCIQNQIDTKTNSKASGIIIKVPLTIHQHDFQREQGMFNHTSIGQLLALAKQITDNIIIIVSKSWSESYIRNTFGQDLFIRSNFNYLGETSQEESKTIFFGDLFKSLKSQHHSVHD